MWQSRPFVSTLAGFGAHSALPAAYVADVASAVLLILEMSDPYCGLFRMPHDGFDKLVRLLTKGAENAADASGYVGSAPASAQRFTMCRATCPIASRGRQSVGGEVPASMCLEPLL